MSDQNPQPQWRIGRTLIGVILIFCGLVYLGVNLGIFDWSLWQHMWRLWPLLLVALGLSLLVRKRISRLLVFFFFLVVAIAGLWFLWTQSEFQRLGSYDTQDVAIDLEQNADLAKLDINLPSATVRLSGPADTSNLLTGRVETRAFEHTVTSERDGNTQKVLISQTGGDLPFVGTQGLVDLQLSARVPFEISARTGKIDATLDFSSLHVRRLLVESGASSINVLFSNIAARAEAEINVGASSVTLSAPEGVGVRIAFSSGISSTSLSGLEKIDEYTYASKDFEQSEKQIMIHIQSGVSSIVFNYR